MAYDICPNCGQPTEQDTKFCANCGTKLDEGNPSDANVTAQNDSLNDREYAPTPTVEVKGKSTKKVFIVIAVILAIMILIVGALYLSYKKQVYKNNLKNMLLEVSNGAITTEELGNKVLAVWHNSIWQKNDEETDPFTKTNGKFNDFNTSLDILYADAEFNNGLDKIKNSQQSVVNFMQQLNNPPKEYEESFEQLKTIYQDYMTFTQLVINPTGSYNSFSEDFLNADSKLVNEVQAILVYLK